MRSISKLGAVIGTVLTVMISSCRGEGPVTVDDAVLIRAEGQGPGRSVESAIYTLHGSYIASDPWAGVATDLSNDGNDVYVDGECGVWANYTWGWDLGLLSPRGEKARKCDPRDVTVSLVKGHGNPNDPDDHSGDAAVTPVGTLPIDNMKVRLIVDPAGRGKLLVNLPYCAWDQDNPRRPPRGLGLRFNPEFTRNGQLRFEHSDYLIVTATAFNGAGDPVAWHVHSDPANNLAGCEKGTDDNPAVEYWHMNVDFDVVVTG